jgi:hypothetical protein
MKISKISKLLAKSNEIKREGIQITNTRYKNVYITSDSTDIYRIIK